MKTRNKRDTLSARQMVLLEEAVLTYLQPNGQSVNEEGNTLIEVIVRARRITIRN